jgi:tetratricopeptide (TPR) repeat protein
MGYYVGAAAAFNSALRLHPDFEDANLKLGEAQLALGRYEDARRAFDRALVATPGDPRPREYLKAVAAAEESTD